MFPTVIPKTTSRDPAASRHRDARDIQHLNLTTIILTGLMEAKGSPALTGLNWLTTILFNKPSKAAAESLKIYTGAERRGENLHCMYALKTLMLPSLYLDSFTAGSLFIFAHKCPGVIKSQMKYFLCRQYLSACRFSLPGKRPVRPRVSLQTGDLRKIRENYVNDTAPAESSETLEPKKEGSWERERRRAAVEEGGEHILGNFPRKSVDYPTSFNESCRD